MSDTQADLFQGATTTEATPIVAPVTNVAPDPTPTKVERWHVGRERWVEVIHGEHERLATYDYVQCTCGMIFVVRAQFHRDDAADAFDVSDEIDDSRHHLRGGRLRDLPLARARCSEVRFDGTAWVRRST